MRLALALALVATLVGGAPPSAFTDEIKAGQSLSDVLRQLRASGLDVIYSDELVRPEMRVAQRPRSRPPRQVLDEVLAEHGLAARSGPGGRLLVVKASATAVVRPPTASRRAATELRLEVRSAGDSQPMRVQVSVPELRWKRATDGRGRVAIPIEPGTYDVEAWQPGYMPWQQEGVTAEAGGVVEVKVTLIADDATAPADAAAGDLVLTLRPRHRYEETVEVAAEPLASGAVPPLTVKPMDVMKTAGAFENVFRALPLLPGVIPANEVQGRLSVRGGGPDQNLTIVDGVEVHNPFRLEGVVSAFNSETIDTFELSTGVLSPRHGDRLSSALEVRTRAGRRTSGIDGSAAMSLTDANVVLEGPLPGNRSASWLLAGRRTWYELIAEPLYKLDMPGFQDFQFRLDWPLGDRAGLTLWGLRSRESARLREPVLGPTDSTFGEGIDWAVSNDVLAATFRAPLGRRLSSTTTLSSYRNPQVASQVDGWLPAVDGERSYERRVRVEDLALRQDLLFRATKHLRLEGGFDVHRLDTRWGMRGHGFLSAAWSFRGFSLAPSSWGSRGDEFEEVPYVDTARQATRVGGYLQATFEPSARIALQPALRVERYGINGETAVLPRLGATWRLGSSTRLGATLGWHAQSPGFEKVLFADTFLDFGGTQPLQVRSERSRHVGLSLEHELGPGLGLRAEVYHRRLDRLIVGRIETPDEVARRLTPYEIPADFPGGPPLEPLITGIPVNDGSGTSRGFELSLYRRSAGSKFGASASYSYGVARRESYGLEYPFDYDRRHAVTATADLQVTRSLSLSAAWRAASGLPYTPARDVVSFAAAFNRDRGLRRIPSRVWSGPFPPPGEPPDWDVSSWPYAYTVGAGPLSALNSARFPLYSRVDFRARLIPSWSDRRWELYLDVINVLGSDASYHNNGPFFRSELSQGPNGERQIIKEKAGIPLILPSLGVRFRF